MSTVEFSVRLLSGRRERFILNSDTSILAFKQLLESQLKVPEFHKVALYVGETQLTEGSISDVVLLEASEVQAVTEACIEEAVNVLAEAAANFFPTRYMLPLGRREDEESRIDEKIEKATSFLLQNEAECRQDICNIALKILIIYKQSGDGAERAVLACHLLGKYGDTSIEAGLYGLIDGSFSVVAVAANDALGKIKAQRKIHCEGEINDTDIKGRGNLGIEGGEEVAEGQTSNPEHGEALHAHLVGNDAGAHQAHQLSFDLETAMRESAAEAAAQEGAHVQEVLLRSKIDSAQQQVVVVLRLTKRNSDVLNMLLQDECLQHVRAQIEDAGCEVLPDWAWGAIVLVLLTEKEATTAGVELRAHHIVIVQEYQAHVERALTAIPQRRRPSARPADPEYLNSATSEVLAPNHNATVVPENLAYTADHVDKCDSPCDFEWHVERTFVHCPMPQAEESARSVKSEPCGGAAHARPLKLQRLSK